MQKQQFDRYSFAADGNVGLSMQCKRGSHDISAMAYCVPDFQATWVPPNALNEVDFPPPGAAVWTLAGKEKSRRDLHETSPFTCETLFDMGKFIRQHAPTILNASSSEPVCNFGGYQARCCFHKK